MSRGGVKHKPDSVTGFWLWLDRDSWGWRDWGWFAVLCLTIGSVAAWLYGAPLWR